MLQKILYAAEVNATYVKNRSQYKAMINTIQSNKKINTTNKMLHLPESPKDYRSKILCNCIVLQENIAEFWRY